MTTPHQPGPYGPPLPGYATPPPPPKKNRVPLIIILGIAGGLLLLGVIGSLVGDETTKDDGKPAAGQSQEPAQKDTGDSPPTQAEKAKDEDGEAPVKMTAEAADYTPGLMAESGKKYTAVKVVIRNEGTEEIAVNPLYFAGKDADNFKHDAKIGTGNDSDLNHADLAPGENVQGFVVFKGDVDIKKIEFKAGMIGTTYSAPVT